MWAETIAGLKAGRHYHVVGLAAGGDRLIGVRMKTGEKALQCSWKNWGEISLNCALQWINFHQVDSLCLKCTQPVPTKAFAVPHEERSNFANGGLVPSFMSQFAWHFPTEAFPVNSVWSQPTSESFTHHWVSFTALNTICISLVYWFKKILFIVFIFLLNEGAWKDRGLVCFVRWVYPHLLAPLAGT